MKYLPIAILLTVLAHIANSQNGKGSFSGNPYVAHLDLDLAQTDAKTKAFSVLTEKCNVCHATKKRTDIFTLENMDSLAVDIHKQVFVKRKMPKGRKIKLTENESQALKDWLKIVLNDTEI